MSHAVEINRLTKTYGDVKAVDSVSFTLEPNKIYGLLGRNGAGKTTIMHMLTAQLFPTSGEMKVFGEAPYENAKVLSQICFIKESQKYPDTYRVCDVLNVASDVFAAWDMEFAMVLVDLFQLPLKRKMKKLSRGMLSSVGIVVGLASRAPLTIFDEPYLGLDAVARSIFYDQLIADYAQHPRTVVLSTHLIDEVSRLLEHILVIDKGRLILNEEADDLRDRAFAIAGLTTAVDGFLAGRTVINRETLGGLTTAAAIGPLSGAERKQAKELGLEVAPVSLQQLVVFLTQGKIEREAVESK